MQAKRRVRRTLEDFMASMEKGESQELLLILKGDVSGSVEALEDSLAQIDVGEEVSLPLPTRSSSASTSARRARRRSWPSARASRSATTR